MIIKYTIKEFKLVRLIKVCSKMKLICYIKNFTDLIKTLIYLKRNKSNTVNGN